MRSEFRKGDVIVDIGGFDVCEVFSSDRVMYYVVNRKRCHCGIPKDIAHEDYVKVGRKAKQER